MRIGITVLLWFSAALLALVAVIGGVKVLDQDSSTEPAELVPLLVHFLALLPFILCMLGLVPEHINVIVLGLRRLLVAEWRLVTLDFLVISTLESFLLLGLLLAWKSNNIGYIVQGGWWAGGGLSVFLLRRRALRLSLERDDDE